MLRPALHTPLAFGCLLVPAILLAWFHHACFPAIVLGTRHLLGTRQDLPIGFELLCRFQLAAYLPLLLIAVVAALSWRFPTLRSPLCLALCAGFLATVCFLFAFLLSTPALFYGLSL